MLTAGAGAAANTAEPTRRVTALAGLLACNLAESGCLLFFYEWRIGDAIQAPRLLFGRPLRGRC